ncbi:TORTIFOLIA1-like protein 2 [Corylus avellana]|uniref:TORTIFOLIA1-like protein 2 n=1 Tax=Corylus avellana TaxID=13451 RepID=UPI00286B6CB9|nr:TORTIFOLIA1-like protein 2 [Corylus avellana]XP_059454494.1 TORTIFOLIA1-like protein 2 [Corylus avellana]XP_059454495.1 TORTIFOLIA1-like protein 2 [Corylus avellana]
MKTHAHMKARGPTRVNSQQVIFELKHKVVVALNKLADRDTCQIGVDELEKTAECLTPERIAPFLSCILDTDSEQKSAVRKECIRLMGTLARFHEGLIGPHLGKMVASIVKRLKDPDSVVRDACVETVGILASKLSNRGGEADGVFVVLVKPLFEALGEQNRQVQSGSALCLARIIDNTHDPPISILHKMLTRTTKFLKNPHFMAKPAVIELNRSIIQVGGAPTQNILSVAMAGIQEALKNSDWTTRKAASLALGDIAASGGSFLGSSRASSIRSLESCRFDKVKPVRDAVLQALQYWRSLPGPDTPEPSDAGSSIKENFCGGDYSDLTSTSESGWKDATLKKASRGSNKGTIPLSIRKTCQNYVENQHSKADDWNIEIAVPKSHNVSLGEFHNEESEGSSVTKTLERMSTDVTSAQDIGYEYVPMDDKQECSSVCTLATDNFETKFVAVSHECLEEGSSVKPIRRTQRFAAEEISDEQIYSAKMQDRRSLDSTVTESFSQTASGCCSQMANEMVFIRKQLLEIENKQSNLMDLLQVFTTGIMDSLTSIQSRVVGLEHVVDRLAQDVVHRGRNSDLASSRLVKQSQTVHSPRLSTCTPRPSVDILNRQSSLLSVKSSDIREVNAVGRGRSSISAKQDTDMWTNAKVNITRNPMGKDMQKSSGHGMQNVGCGQIRKDGAIFPPGSSAIVRQNGLENKNSLWKRVKGFLCEGDLDSAYVEALCSHDELVLVELLDRTGPILERLSPKTVSDILSTLASYLLEQRFMNSIIPWLQQAVDLSAIHGPNYLNLSAKARREFLSAIQEAMNMEFSNPMERRIVTQLAMKLHNVWGK